MMRAEVSHFTKRLNFSEILAIGYYQNVSASEWLHDWQCGSFVVGRTKLT
jgi:hypothetical protein